MQQPGIASQPVSTAELSVALPLKTCGGSRRIEGSQLLEFIVAALQILES